MNEGNKLTTGTKLIMQVDSNFLSFLASVASVTQLSYISCFFSPFLTEAQMSENLLVLL